MCISSYVYLAQLLFGTRGLFNMRRGASSSIQFFDKEEINTSATLATQ